MPFASGEAERDRWPDLMGAAMRETAVPEEIAPEIPEMAAIFAQVADFMRNR